MKMRMIGGYVVDLAVDPAESFHPSIAKEFVDVPEGAPADLAPGYRLDGDVWTAPPPAEPTPPPAPATFAERREAKRAEVRRKRSAVEDAGTTLNGVPLRTDETSLLKINGAVSLFDKDPTLAKVDFEAQPGIWVDLDKATMTAIAVVVGRHIQAAFSRARVLDGAIVALADGDEDGLAAIDVSAGWPG